MSSGKYVNFNQALPIGESPSILSRIQSAGKNINNTTLMIIGVVLLFAVLAGVYYFYYIAPKTKSKYKPNSEHISKDSAAKNEAELILNTYG